MKAQYFSYWPFLLSSLLVLCLVLIVWEGRFFRWVKLYWFVKRSRSHQVSSLFLCLSFLSLSLALLNWHGQQEEKTVTLPLSKTVILIDASLSMMAEDLSPNRFERALFFARTFAKTVTNHQISIFIFSEAVKKIVPFTTDKKLIDARLAALSTLAFKKGGSNISGALEEVVSYFPPYSQEWGGNILLLTDGEETYPEKNSLKIPSPLSVAVLGFGSLEGERIPFRDEKGRLLGFKRHKGQDVVTKVDALFFEGLGKQIDNFLSLVHGENSDTEAQVGKIEEFFQSKQASTLAKIGVLAVPYYYRPFLSLGIGLFIISCFLRGMSPYRFSLIFFLIAPNFFGPQGLASSLFSFSSSPSSSTSLSPSPSPSKISLLFEELKHTDKVKEVKTQLAFEFLNQGYLEEGMVLYQEILQNYQGLLHDPYDAFAYGTGLLMEGKIKEGLSIYETLLSQVESRDPMMGEVMDKLMRNNLLTSILNPLPRKRPAQKREGAVNSLGQNEESSSDSSQGHAGDFSNKENQLAQAQGGREDNDGVDNGGEGRKVKRDQSWANKEIPLSMGILEELLNSDQALQGRYLNVLEGGRREGWKKITQKKGKDRDRDRKDW